MRNANGSPHGYLPRPCRVSKGTAISAIIFNSPQRYVNDPLLAMETFRKIIAGSLSLKNGSQCIRHAKGVQCIFSRLSPAVYFFRV